MRFHCKGPSLIRIISTERRGSPIRLILGELLQARFDRRDLFAREALKRIDKLVDLGFEAGNIGVRVVLLRDKDLVNELIPGTGLAITHFTEPSLSNLSIEP